MRLLILVVLYRRACRASETLRSLAACRNTLHDSLVVVWDNSPEEAVAEERLWLRSALPRAAYFHDASNPGLASVYNRVIDRFLKAMAPETSDFLLLLDQDSEVDQTFFTALEHATTEHPEIALFLPLVAARGRIVSPANLYGFKGSYWKKKRSGLTPSEHHTAINSGMVISAPYLREHFPGYDERLQFYGTDNFFMREYGKTNRQFVVLDCILQHDLSCFTPENIEVKLWRHRENVNSLRILHEGCGMRTWLAHAYCRLHNLRQAIKYCDRRFLV